MSCLMTNESELAKIAAYVGEILESYNSTGPIIGVKRITPTKSLMEALKNCYDWQRGGWLRNDIFLRLYALNVEAYNSRYPNNKIDLGKHVPKMPETWVDTDEETRKEWMPRLYNLLRFYCYQTAEDETINDPLRLAIDELFDAVGHVIATDIVHTMSLKWGQW